MSLFKKEYDPVTQCYVEWHFDDVTQKMYKKSSQDISSLLEQNKRLRDAESDYRRFGKDSVMHKIGSVPNIIIDKIMKEHGINVYCGDEDQTKRFYKVIREEYPYLMTTNAKGVLSGSK